MSYEITFLGSSGGPLEHGNCALLVKPASLTYLQVLASPGKPLFMIDAGSGWYALAQIIHNSRNNTSESLNFSLNPLKLYEDSLHPSEYLEMPPSLPFSGLEGSPLLLLKQILARVSALLLSHPHLDHIQSMILNLAGATAAGDNLVVHASQFTANALNTHVFNGVVWPDLVLLGFLSIQPISEQNSFTISGENYSVTYFEVSHGIVANNGHHTGNYQSLAFLICDNSSQSKILVFGDVEADSILRDEKNARVWAHVVPAVLDGSLKCVILECSTPIQEPGANLYGHLTPPHLMEELGRLERFCAEKGRTSSSTNAPSFVKGLKVIVTHVKETCDGSDPRRKILSELQLLNESMGLQVSISIATTGILVIV